MVAYYTRPLSKPLGFLLCGFILLVGCDEVENNDSDNATMRPGESCMNCHDQGGPSGKDLTVAGTLFKDPDGNMEQQGSTIRLYDSTGALMVELTTNSVGNFYTKEPVTFPAQVEVDCSSDSTEKKVEMPSPSLNGGCNSCHNGSNTDFAFCQRP